MRSLPFERPNIRRIMEDLLQVGVITSVHGVHGEVKVYPTTNDANRFKKLKDVILDTGKKKIDLKIVSVKFFKQFVILKFEGYDNPNDIEKYRQCPLLVTRENAVKLSKDEYFIADLVGIDVFDESGHIGVMTDVIETGANDVYVIKEDNGNELLLPAIKQCILEVDIENRKMLVHVMEGLRD